MVTTSVGPTVEKTQSVLGARIFAASSLPQYLQHMGCCRMHVTSDTVMKGAHSALGDKVGRHPAIYCAYVGGVTECHAMDRTLAADRTMASAAWSMLVPGFAYLKPGGLTSCRRWATGAVLGMAAFGNGYCYLLLMQPRMRMRVARILGPCPFVADVWMLYRLAGLNEPMVKFRGVKDGLMHVEPGQKRKGLEVARELWGLVDLRGDMRIGWDSDERPNFPPVATMVSQAPIRRAPVRYRDAARKLVGDAMHGLDVKTVVLAFTSEWEYSQVAAGYMAATAQKQYLQSVGVWLAPNTSNHTWGSEFECRYYGEFRAAYLRWLIEDLQSSRSGFIACGPVWAALEFYDTALPMRYLFEALAVDGSSNHGDVNMLLTSQRDAIDALSIANAAAERTVVRTRGACSIL